MAPLVEQAMGLVKRYATCSSGYYYSNGRCWRDHSSWHYWGRWVFAGLAVLFLFIVFASLFRNSRRRRSRGTQPIYGTGWMAPAPPYYPPPPQYVASDPSASHPPPEGHKFGQNDGYGYYGNQQQEGIQMQPPAQTYHRDGTNDYAPPPGPPPAASPGYGEYAPPPGPPPNTK